MKPLRLDVDVLQDFGDIKFVFETAKQVKRKY